MTATSGTEGRERVGDSRRPVDPRVVESMLEPALRWRIDQVAVTGSTNADLASKAGAAETGQVLTAEEQLSGRGRSGRDWFCPAGAGLMFSVLLREPAIPVDRRGWVGAVLGLAIVRALDRVGLDASLKWPNDVLIGPAKCAGILGEAVGDALIVGAGINVSLTAAELPRDDATSLLLAGGRADRLDREALLAGILNEFGDLVDRWVTAGGDIDASGVRPAYRVACSTIGARVRLMLPGGAQATATAIDVAVDGALIVRDDRGERRSYSAADVVHLRPDRPTAGLDPRP